MFVEPLTTRTRSAETRGRRSRRKGLLTALLPWGLVVGLGVTSLARYAGTPGALEAPPARWPADTALARTTHGFTLLVFAHPQCACTRATLAQLATVLARAASRDIHTQVVLASPATAPPGFADGAIAATARRIAGVRLVVDADEREARRFRVLTSGETILYDADGRLRFHGGITQARGHQGDNGGQDRLLAVLAAQPVARRSSAVFGCALRRAEDEAREGGTFR